MKIKPNSYRQLLSYAAAVSLGFALAGSSAVAATKVGVFVEDSFIPRDGGSQKISVAARSDEGINVDIHIGLIAPDQTIYEYPNWNTKLQPWLPNFRLPANFTFPATFIFDASRLPGGLKPGIWYAAVALTEPGTLKFVDVALKPFRVVDEGSGSGTAYGSVELSRAQTYYGTNVWAGGIFLDAAASLDDFKNAYLGDTPGVNECKLYEIPVDLSAFTEFDINTLDAGPALAVVKGGQKLSMPKDGDALAFDYDVYSASPATTFYQGGVPYRFEGYGGSDVGSFSISLGAPQPLTLTNPPVSASHAHNASQPLNVRWTGGGGFGEVDVSLSGGTLSVAVTIHCRFSDDGRGTIPANLITQMKAILDESTSDPSIPIPGFEDIELPDGFEIPAIPVVTTLMALRTEVALFNAPGLDTGIATIGAGAAVDINLQ
jgi:hypothetical protein